MKKVAIVQSNYIPWKGYFDLINMVDEFILYDDAQYTRRDWRNRNWVKTQTGILRLTIPVRVKGKYHQRIRDVIISDRRWAERHWKSICHNYARAPFLKELLEIFKGLYCRCQEKTHLSDVNFLFLKTIAEMLGSNTHISQSMEYEVIGTRNEKLVNLCRQAGATEYISGPSASGYLDERLFLENGIRVRWMNYDHYPQYPQLFSPPFMHEVSIVDLLMNVGPQKVKKYMLSFNCGK